MPQLKIIHRSVAHERSMPKIRRIANRRRRWGDHVRNTLSNLAHSVENASRSSRSIILRIGPVVGCVRIVLAEYAKAWRRRIAAEIVHVRSDRGRTKISPIHLPRRNWQELVVMVTVTVVALLVAPISKFGHAGLPLSGFRKKGCREAETHPPRIGKSETQPRR